MSSTISQAEINTYLRTVNIGSVTKEALQAFEMDITGFMSNSKTLMHINDQIGIDSELNLHFREQIMPRITAILEELRKEISKFKD